MGKTLSDNAINQIRSMRSDVCQLKSQGGRSISAGLPPLLPSSGVKSTESVLPVPAMITGGSNGVYSVDLYGDGYSAASTGSAMLVALELSYGETVPTGTQVIACPWQMVATGSGE